MTQKYQLDSERFREIQKYQNNGEKLIHLRSLPARLRYIYIYIYMFLYNLLTFPFGDHRRPTVFHIVDPHFVASQNMLRRFPRFLTLPFSYSHFVVRTIGFHVFNVFGDIGNVLAFSFWSLHPRARRPKAQAAL